MDIDGNRWNQREKARIRWKLIDIDINRCKEMEIDVNKWRQMEMDGIYGMR